MNFHQDDWVHWLPLAEFARNNVISETTGVSPFFANYGFNPKLGTEPFKPCPPNISDVQKKQFYKANTVADRFQRIIDQLKALAQQAINKYKHYANEKREDTPLYHVGQLVYVNTRNMKTNRPMKKGDNKVTGPYKALEVYRRACKLKLPNSMKVYPVFHNSFLQPHANTEGLPGQNAINNAESRHLHGRILEREDGSEELVERWEFEKLLDSHKDYRTLTYLVKWKDHKATWQPATDLKGQDEAILKYHSLNPGKAGPPTWVKKKKETMNAERVAMIFKPFETNGCVGRGYCHSTDPSWEGYHMRHVTCC
jgi:hypothetical protein